MTKRLRSDSGLDAERRSWPAFLFFLLMLAPILGVSHFIGLHRVDERDPFLFAVFGRELLHGAALYGDVWDNKPPMVYWWNAGALWLGDGRLEAAAVTFSAAVAGSCLLVWAALRRFFAPWPACVGAVLFSFFVTHFHYHVGSNRPETLMVLFDALGYWAFVQLVSGRAWALVWMFVVGAACGLSLATKQVGLGLMAAVVLQQTIAMLFGSIEVRAWLWRSLAFLAGLLIVVGTVCFLVIQFGDAAWGWDAVFGYNWELMRQRSGGAWWPAWVGMCDNLDVLFLPILLASCWVGFVLWNGIAPREKRHAHLIPSGHATFLLIWLAVSLVMSQVAPDGRLHYYAVALPPILLLGAIGIGAAMASVDRRGAAVPAIGSIVLVVLVGGLMVAPVRGQLRKLGQAANEVVDEAATARRDRLVRAIAEHSSVDDRMFVWGYDPELYWEAERSPACRYIGTDKCGSSEIGRRRLAQLLRWLRETNPGVIVVNDAALRNLPAEARGGVEGRAWVDWLHDSYERPDATLDGLWIRKPA